jgi:phosphatidylglycerophosphate synthase
VFDRRARELCSPVLDAVGGRLARAGVKANPLTGLGWAVGVGACVAVGLRLWPLALVAWLLNRLIDGLDGALARRLGATDFGGYLDLLADFSIYSGFIVALAVAEPGARLASAVLLFTYYLSGAALLGASALLDRRGIERDDERAVRFLGGLAEGLETMIAYVIIVVAPSLAVWVEWVFASMVLVTAFQRVVWARRALRGVVRATSVSANVHSPAT